MCCKSVPFVLFVLLEAGRLMGQTGIIKGRVFNGINNEAVPFANVVIDSSTTGTTSDMDGNYRIEGLAPGVYNVQCSFVGFKFAVAYEVTVTSVKPAVVNFELVEESRNLGVVEITASPFNKTEESPLSMRTIGATEIYRSPGGNRDISKVIQILPGIASSVSFRNDLIVRGGAPNENRFFLDGIEVPNINHFATQGSSGGPVGLINVNFIRDVDFYAGAFPANRGNALSAVLEFRQIEGNDQKLDGTFMIGSSDVGLTLDGPAGKKSTFIFSARRSYLQFLFKALALPFLPTYNDFQYKQTFKLNNKNKVVLIGLGAIDDFELNTAVNDGQKDEELIRRNRYLLGNLPVNEQWNYAVGGNWTHFSDNSYQNLVVSRNHLDNSAVKYRDNIQRDENLLLDYRSQEIENKLRVEHTFRKAGWKWNAGAGYERVFYSNSTYLKKAMAGQPAVFAFDSELNVNKFAAFTQLSKGFRDERLALSLGLRTDFNDYSRDMNNPFEQLSPRFSASYAISGKLNFNFNAGRYYQLPPYTVMGYRDSSGSLVNKANRITFIRADHAVAGLEYKPGTYSKISVEGFYKRYGNYPFLTGDSISLANLGSDFGVIGNEPAVSLSQGRSAGVELLIQQKLSTSVYGILSYTYVRSAFTDRTDEYIPSSWDNRHILNITAGKKLKGDWELGAKFRYLGGAPYTPYDEALSDLREVWDVTGQGIPDWKRLNRERNPAVHGLDIRVDKKWYFEKWALNAYVDVQNCYNFKAEGRPYLDVERDMDGNPVIDPMNPLSYKLTEIANTYGTVLPSVGLMVEF